MAITIVGLGPGEPGLLTREAWELFSEAGEVYLRTGRHPTVSGLPAGLTVHTFDTVYEESGDFATVYREIVARVLALGRRPGGVVYGVPGHPLVGEATVTGLLEEAPAAGLTVRIVDGLSFVEPVLTALQVDGMTGLQVVDALEVAASLHPPLNPDSPALLGQLYSRELASDVKLTLMNVYSEDHQVHLVHSAGTAEQCVETVPVYAMDHSRQIAHLTALYVPALPVVSGLERFQETIARLRGPGGCPWDQEQTHQSLTRGLIEETTEVVEALDAGDMAALCEELGDLLLHIVMQTQLATEEGEFTMSDVIAGIEAKIRRRHPHVFAEEQVDGVAQVLANWDDIKQRERHGAKEDDRFGGIPASLSALAWAEAHLRRAATDDPGGWERPLSAATVGAKVTAVASARDADEGAAALGELLWSIVAWARQLDIDADMALRNETRRWRGSLRPHEGDTDCRPDGIDQRGEETPEHLTSAGQAGGEADGQ